MKVGYARTSTIEQRAGFDAQVKDLRSAGCEKLFDEQVSSVARRPRLEAALDFIREGDTLVVTKLDRLARSTQHLLEIASNGRERTLASLILEWIPARQRGSSCSPSSARSDSSRGR